MLTDWSFDKWGNNKEMEEINTLNSISQQYFP